MKDLTLCIVILWNATESALGEVDPLDSWHLRSALVDGRPSNEYRAMAYGNGQFVVAGTEGVIEGTVGGSLLSRNSGTSLALNGATFANGVFFVVGESGTILASKNTYTWERSGLVSSDCLRGICSGGGVIVIVGDNGIVLVSTNSESWEIKLPATTNTLSGVSYGAGTFVAVGDSGTVVRSMNGRHWVGHSTGSAANLRSVCFENNRFVAVGDEGTILSSSDGVSWTIHSSRTSESLHAVAVQDGIFVAVGANGVVRMSPNGSDWFIQDVGWSKADLLCLAATGHGGFAVAGRGGTSLGATVWNSQLLWVNNSLGGARDLQSVAYGNGAFVAVGGDAVTLTSRNAAEWVWRRTPSLESLYAVCYGQRRFVAAGLTVFFQGAAAATYASDEGIRWYKRGEVDSFRPFRGIQLGGGRFVAVGDGGLVATSEDSLVWTQLNSGTEANLRGVAYGNGRIVVVGSRKVLSSGDGIAWRSEDVAFLLTGVTFGNGQFVAVGTSGVIATSEDGDDWTSRASGTSKSFYAVVYGEGAYVAVGEGVVSSWDGVHWVEHEAPTASTLRSVAYGNGSFVAVGDATTIIQSDSLAPTLLGRAVPEEGTFRVTLEGLTVPGWRLQATSEFGVWEDLLVFTDFQTGASYLDSSAKNYSKRFYRVVLP